MHSIKLTFCAAFLGGCVSAGTYQAKAEETQRLRHEAIDREKALLGRVGTLEKQVDDQAQRLRSEEKGRAQLAKQLDDSTALVGELRERLTRLGHGEEISAEAGALGESLREAQGRLEELRRQKSGQEVTARAYRGFLERLRGPVDAGQLEVKVRDGRVLIAASADLLFEPGRPQVRPEGQAALGRVAESLRALPGRRFLVAAHSDDLPTRASRYPSSWELSALRAVEVTKLLVQGGVKPQDLGAAGHGEFDPLYPNDSPEHRAANRRVEITLQPLPGDLPTLDVFGGP